MWNPGTTPSGTMEGRETVKRLRVTVVGGGPAGLYVAIGLAQNGHEVHVFEKLANPSERSTVNRDRSYPVDITARGMHALRKLPGVTDIRSPFRQRLLEFFGHGGPRGEALQESGLIGTRDDIVLGLLDTVRTYSDRWTGSITIKWSIDLAGVDLTTRTLTPPTVAEGSWDLICACDGKNSVMRSSAAEQDPTLVVTQVHGRAGEETYKTFNMDRCDGAGDDLAPGWLYGGPDVGVYARMPSGGALGILPVSREEVEAGVAPGLLQRRLPQLLQYVTDEELVAFEGRPWGNAAGGYTVNRLHSGIVAFVGDAGCSPPPPGQGVNHAFEAAACLVAHVTSNPGDIPKALQSFSEERILDEEAYAFLAAERTKFRSCMCVFGMMVGLHRPWRAWKDSSAPYREATSMHHYV
eukprot:TRINITY_DN23829_c0_g1_i1.p1 TRINITY_DN23829_c0_g1~~TRINITY_DN23829_c0_g1_i1.p1  ORF type:complete len:409 (-),score=53.71 TRINITY_DN23829_c0_g1_i1:44-1270(-)